MTTLFQITLGYDEVNRRYAIAAYNVKEDQVTSAAGTINKAWREIGDRIKSKEKGRKNFPLPPPPDNNGSSIITPTGNGIDLPDDRKIIIAGS